MVSDLLFSELLLFDCSGCISSHGLWSHDRATGCQTTSTPATPPRKRASDLQPSGTHPQAFLCRLRAIRRASSPTAPLSATTHGFCPGTHHAVDTSTSSAPIPPVTMGAGWDGAISAPTAIPTVAPGGSGTVWPAGALFSRPTARWCMAKRVPVERIVYVVASLAEGLGIRAVARVFAVDPNTRAAVVSGDGRPSPRLFAVFPPRRTRHAGTTGRALCRSSAVKAGQVSEGEAIERLSRSPHWVWGQSIRSASCCWRSTSVSAPWPWRNAWSYGQNIQTHCSPRGYASP